MLAFETGPANNSREPLRSRGVGNGNICSRPARRGLQIPDAMRLASSALGPRPSATRARCRRRYAAVFLRSYARRCGRKAELSRQGGTAHDGPIEWHHPALAIALAGFSDAPDCRLGLATALVSTDRQTNKQLLRSAHSLVEPHRSAQDCFYRALGDHTFPPHTPPWDVTASAQRSY